MLVAQSRHISFTGYLLSEYLWKPLKLLSINNTIIWMEWEGVKIAFCRFFLSSVRVLWCSLNFWRPWFVHKSPPYCNAQVHDISISDDLYFTNTTCSYVMKDAILCILSNAGTKRLHQFYCRLSVSTGLGATNTYLCVFLLGLLWCLWCRSHSSQSSKRVNMKLKGSL